MQKTDRYNLHKSKLYSNISCIEEKPLPLKEFKDRKSSQQNSLNNSFETSKQKIKNDLINKMYIGTGAYSQNIPEWFNVYNSPLINEAKNQQKKEPSLYILSKHNSWMTVTPSKMNRNSPLEKVKLVNIFN